MRQLSTKDQNDTDIIFSFKPYFICVKTYFYLFYNQNMFFNLVQCSPTAACPAGFVAVVNGDANKCYLATSTTVTNFGAASVSSFFFNFIHVSYVMLVTNVID